MRHDVVCMPQHCRMGVCNPKNSTGNVQGEDRPADPLRIVAAGPVPEACKLGHRAAELCLTVRIPAASRLMTDKRALWSSRSPWPPTRSCGRWAEYASRACVRASNRDMRGPTIQRIRKTAPAASAWQNVDHVPVTSLYRMRAGLQARSTGEAGGLGRTEKTRDMLRANSVYIEHMVICGMRDRRRLWT